MIRSWVRSEKSLLLAALSGILLALAFPRPSLFFLAWFALVPLLLTCRERPFRNGFVAGVSFYALLLYWLNIVMTTFGRLHPLLSVVAWLLLAAYLALFFGASTWLCFRLRERLSLPLLISFPLVWTGLDYLREFFLTGFPWGALGYSQAGQLWAVQSLDLWGVYGLTALLAFSNVLVAETWRAWRCHQVLPRFALSLFVLLFSANLGYGIWCLKRPLDEREKKITVSLAQGNIDQSVKWNPSWQKKTVERYLELSRQGAAEGAELLLWPESATPFYFQDGKELAQQVRSFSRERSVAMLFGSPAYRAEGSGFALLNSAFLLSPQGEVLGRSDKVHLVPFGEYVPLKRVFPFINKLVVGVGDFSPGSLTPLAYDDARFGVLVCYEGVFPELSRSLVEGGADLLVNITNDAWYGRSSAPYQHLAMARMRAIENRVWLARVANTGVSALISPSGRLTATTDIFETTQVTGPVGLGAGPSLYRTIGDLFPASCLLFTLVVFLLSLRRNRPSSTD